MTHSDFCVSVFALFALFCGQPSDLRLRPPVPAFCASRAEIPSHAPFRVDSFPPSDFSELQKPLDHFRAKTKRLKIHALEHALLWIVGAHLVFLPWAIGAMTLWSQWISLGFAAVGFVVALLPRSYTEEHTGSNTFRLVMWPRPTRASSKTTCPGSRPSPCTTPTGGALATAEEELGVVTTG